MNRFRRSGFSIDSTRFRDGIRERWIPLGDDGGDLRARRRGEDAEPRGREVGRDDAVPAWGEDR